MIKKFQKPFLIGLIVLLVVFNINNYITIQRYEQVVSERIAIILHPVTPDNLSEIADKGKISREMTEVLKRGYASFHFNVSEIESLGKALNKLPQKQDAYLSDTTNYIHLFFTQIYNDIENNNLEIMELNDNQIEVILLLHELSESWRAVFKTY